VSGLFQYDSLRTTYGVVPFTPTTLGSAGSINQSVYTVSGFLRYYFGSSYIGGGVSTDWGTGNWTDITGPSGSFHSNGYDAFLSAGNVFTLFDSRRLSATRVATKGRAPAVLGGYAVALDTSAWIGYDKSRVGGFTDSTGFAWGDENLRYWAAGAQARLFMTIPRGWWTWTPYVAATFSSQFSYSATLDIPAQTAQAADTLLFGGPQTFWGGRAGVSALAANGIEVGAQGFYRESAQFRVAGGQVFIRYIWPDSPARQGSVRTPWTGILQ